MTEFTSEPNESSLFDNKECSCSMALDPDAVNGEADNVDHPQHYNRGKIEVIDFIEDQKLGFHLGNVVKYAARAEHKNGLEDLKKAQWYLEREIGRRNGTLITTTQKNFGKKGTTSITFKNANISLVNADDRLKAKEDGSLFVQDKVENFTIHFEKEKMDNAEFSVNLPVRKYDRVKDGDFRCDACELQGCCEWLFGWSKVNCKCPLPSTLIFLRRDKEEEEEEEEDDDEVMHNKVIEAHKAAMKNGEEERKGKVKDNENINCM
jgi:hypothetical protein